MQNTKTNKEKDSQKIPFNEALVDFIQRRRKLIFASIAVIIFAFIGTVVFLIVNDNLRQNAILQVEDLNSRFDELIFFVDDEDRYEEIESLLADLVSFAENGRGFAQSKAWSLAAGIYAARLDWALTEEAWLNAARAGQRTYLGPISLFNAATAAEEQGKFEEAISLLQQAINHRFEFPAAPRAQFSIGRLNEQLGNYSAALEAYRAVMISWPEITIWQQLAHNRIIALEIYN